MTLLCAASPVHVLSGEAMRAKMHGLLAHTPAQPWIRDTDDPVILVWKFTSHPERPISTFVTSSSSSSASTQQRVVQTDSRVLSQPVTDHTGRTLVHQPSAASSQTQDERHARPSVTDVDAMTSSRSPSPQIRRIDSSIVNVNKKDEAVLQKRRGRPRKSATAATPATRSGGTRAVKTEPAVQPAALGAHGAVEVVQRSTVQPVVEHTAASAKAVKRVATVTTSNKRRKANQASSDDTKRQLPIEQFLTRRS